MSDSGTVLIIEDDAGIRSLLVAVAHQVGFASRVANDGEEALDLLDGDGADSSVILLDLVLPKVDGLDVLRHLDRNAPHLLRRVIVITAAGDSIFRDRPEVERAWCLRRKPLDIIDLMEQIARCAESADQNFAS
jgi:DNA-binding NtrC family response regulator